MEHDLDTAEDPIALFNAWLGEAKTSEINDPNAMALATVDSGGMPNVRMVLLKGVEDGGFVFFTNFGSAKGRELLANPKAALCFHWKSLRRQVRVRGAVSQVTDAAADAYFATRPRGSRVGAWASKQSQPLESRFALEKSVAAHAAKFALGEVPRPEWWSGFRIAADEMEFWKDGKFRLHHRVTFRRSGESWEKARLYP
jgi:pyridoxamine 5'-phosphate oxidase